MEPLPRIEATARRSESVVNREGMDITLHDEHVVEWGAFRHRQAQQFLDRLDPEAKTFTFQTFDDTKAKRSGLARIVHGNIDGQAEYFDSLQEERAGIFVTIAATDGQGRQAHNITRVRAVFVDLDGPPLQPVLEAGLEPHFVVASSPKRFHAYWLVDDCPLDQFGRVQLALARRFDGDTSPHDLPRVMRLPGFRHFKHDAETAKLLEGIGTTTPPYRLAEIVDKLDLELDAPKEKTRTRLNGTGEKIAPGNRHRHLFALGRSMARRSTPEAVRAALDSENQARCDPPVPDTISTISQSVLSPRKTPSTGRQKSVEPPNPSGPPLQWPDPQPLPFGLPPVVPFDPNLLPQSLPAPGLTTLSIGCAARPTLSASPS